MEEVTLRALKGSIQKWEKIVEGKGKDEGVYNCPLCGEFYCEGACRACPVYHKSGYPYCGNTPYVEWSQHQTEVHGSMDNHVVSCSICTTLAQIELDFLKSLLPLDITAVGEEQ